MPPPAAATVTPEGWQEAWPIGRGGAAVVFLLTFLLLLSDYVCRQALVPMFPLLKKAWSLSDGQLGGLVSVVALAVGVLTAPLAMVADRAGRVRAIVAMAVLWSAATLACGLASSYGQLLAARVCMGVGEAAYGSVGGAILFSVFPRQARALVGGAFLAGGALGSVLGLAMGGVLSAKLGMQNAFLALATTGFLLAILFALTVRLPALRTGETETPSAKPLRGLTELLATPTLLLGYGGGGLQFFTLASLIAWTPSLLTRAYGLTPAEAGGMGGLLVLFSAVGMAASGGLADAVATRHPALRAVAGAAICALTAVFALWALVLQPGFFQLMLLASAFACAGGGSGPASALAADVSRPAVHATTLALATLAFNILGQAPGPWITGMIADHLGLVAGLRSASLASLVAAAAFMAAGRRYARDVARLRA